MTIFEVTFDVDIQTCIRVLKNNSNTCFILFTLNRKQEALQVYNIVKLFEQYNMNLNVINIEPFINAFDESFIKKANKQLYIDQIKSLFKKSISEN